MNPTDVQALEKRLRVLEKKLARSERYRAELEDKHDRDQALYRRLHKELEAARREAEVETALERVRARAMAMQTSDELSALVATLFEELKALDVALSWCMINLVDEQAGTNTLWATSPEIGAAPESFPMKLEVDRWPFHRAFMQAWKERKAPWVYVMAGAEKAAYDGYLFSETEIGRLPDPVKAAMQAAGQHVFSCTFSTFGGLQTVGEEPLSGESLDILCRFGKVFDLTYTRFNDLKQAEAQAREAQIQLALERVRARTMAMQRSDELSETSFLLAQQVRELGIEAWGCAFHIYADDEAGDYEWFSNEDGYLPTYKTPRKKFFKHFYEKRQKGEDLYIKEFKGKACADHYQYLMSLPVVGDALKQMQESGIPLPASQIDHVAYFKYGYLLFITYEPVPEAYAIFRRFAKEFEQTYTRFLDLKQAEAQAREARIEAALERVRSRTMAMQRSDELSNVIAVVSNQLQHLELRFDHVSFAINSDAEDYHFWTSIYGQSRPYKFIVPYLDNPIANRTKTFRSQGLKFFQDTLTPEENRAWLEHAFKHNPSNHLSSREKTHALSHGFSRSVALMPNILLAVGNYASEPYSEDENEIIRRFAAVFEQAYTRFLDLQKAEAQAREAQIEAALERVRARAMAMHKADELVDVTLLLRKEMGRLGVEELETSSIYIHDEATGETECWFSIQDHNNEQNLISDHMTIDLQDTWVGRQMQAFYRSGDPKTSIVMQGAHRTEWITYCAEKSDLFSVEGFYGAEIPERTYHLYRFTNGYMGAAAPGNISAESWDLLKRSTAVFSLAYTRFLDLKQAEAQAREARIEAALERVRARTMAMQRSDELSVVAAVLYAQLNILGFRTLQCGFDLLDRETLAMSHWFTNAEGKVVPASGKATDVHILTRHPVADAMLRAWQRGEPGFFIELSGEDLASYMALVKTYLPIPDAVWRGGRLADVDRIFINHFHFSQGVLSARTLEPLTSEQRDVGFRFTKVFDLAYTRFLDLKKAEEQAREAQIEAALERVRSRTMAMQRSEELAVTAGVLFEQMQGLGIALKRCVIGIIDADKASAKLWFTSSEGKVVPGSSDVPLTEHKNLRAMFEAWKKKEARYTFELVGEARAAWTRYVTEKANMPIPEYQPDKIDRQKLLTEPAVFNCFFFLQGILLFHTVEHLSPAETTMLKRFTRVFQQTYARFLDLQQAEARAREAVRQASLDRVRAEIASMRTTADLDRITPLLWRELTTLGVPFLRCGVFIAGEDARRFRAHLSLPDGDALAAFDLPFDSAPTTRALAEHWKDGRVYREQWDRAQFVAWMRSMAEQGVFEAAAYPGAEAPPETLALLFAPFAQGMLYVGSPEPLSDDDVAVVQSLADAFAVAYARYEDFRKLEAAKAEVERAYDELNEAKDRLVQSEKLASLGALTAGIAHEIKNPLNFINNFAELNEELADEVVEVLEAGDTEEARAILEDLRQNAAIINQHGKRADGIVRAMMQHARSSGGEHEAVDVNPFVEEYLNLAYHGQRARVPGFNAELVTDLAEDVGTAQMMPQEMGRVLINLLGNAFDAVYEHAASRNGQYAPRVTVSTRRVGEAVEIRVTDNGPGIPDEVREKIFEPFFTTKPTGSGTGLGLSLSHDIVTQGHGGTLTVESAEGKGAAFVVSVPVGA